MIDAERIAGMKDGAIIINTARGGLIDDHELAEAVKMGKHSGDVIMPMLAQDITDFAQGKEVQHVVNRQYLKSKRKS